MSPDFITIGRPITEMTLIGWIPATIWAVCALGQYKADQKIEKALKTRV